MTLNNCTENSGKLSGKTYVVESPFHTVVRIQFTAYYWTALQIHSGRAQKENDGLEFQKFQKNLNILSFCNVTALQSRISDFSKKDSQE